MSTNDLHSVRINLSHNYILILPFELLMDNDQEKQTDTQTDKQTNKVLYMENSLEKSNNESIDWLVGWLWQIYLIIYYRNDFQLCANLQRMFTFSNR